MSDFRSYGTDRFPPVVKNLIIINVLVYAAQLILENSIGLTEKIMLYPEMPSQLHDILVNANVREENQRFRFYQIITHMFAHSPSSIFHILFNMYSLWMFGSQLENRWGGKRFLSFYLLCGVGAAALHLGVQYFRCEQVLQDIVTNQAGVSGRLGGAIAPALGASGAVMGIFAAFAFLFPNTEMMIIPIPIPIKVKWLMIAFAAFDLFGGISGGDGIAHFAHLGGAITGIIMVWIWNRNSRSFY
jgi:membrane associated rhomboid family serine protease